LRTGNYTREVIILTTLTDSPLAFHGALDSTLLFLLLFLSAGTFSLAFIHPY